jgi:hypothetical protein
MPMKIIDYSKTVMYKIVSNDLNINDCYVGSTTEFTKRNSSHKSDCTNATSKKHNLKVYKFIRNNGDWHNWSMILIEMYPCTNNLESLQRERYWCEHLNATLNSLVPSRSLQQYHVDNKECIKQYREDHKVRKMEYDKQYQKKHKERKKQYNVDHKEQINKRQNTVIYCECGCSYTRQNKLRHELSKKHREYVENKLYYDIQRGLIMIKKLDNFFYLQNSQLCCV